MKTIQAAFAQPPMSRRRNMSPKIAISIQMYATQAKKMIIVQRMFRNG